ncbi:MAG: alpha/beta hydrolase [Rhodospirillaceae bacterium]|nr:alpha/beta hydrolase [Rhodospirillales bacterium]
MGGALAALALGGGRSAGAASCEEPKAAPTASAVDKLFPGFKQRVIQANGQSINTLVGGNGPPLLLMHGHPQSAVCFHKIAAALAQHYTLVLPDLRGYGDSSKPVGDEKHLNYSKRQMAKDQVEVMRSLGFEKFQAAGHDRGGRVLHRMALDYPEAVERVAMMDIAPTATMYAKADKEFATKYFWWFFNIQPSPLPETLIGNNLEFYLQTHLTKQNKTPGAITPEAMAEYRRCYTHEMVHAVMEDYRAAATIDLVHDAEDAHKRIQAPLMAIWGDKGVVGKTYDVLQTWRDKAVDVRGGTIPCGHYLAEEAPNETTHAFLSFFRTT